MADSDEIRVHPLSLSLAQRRIFVAAASSWIPSAAGPPSVDLLSATTSIETAGAGLNHTNGGSFTQPKESQHTPKELMPPSKGAEKQQDSSRAESNVVELLVDTRDHMEPDDDVRPYPHKKLRDKSSLEQKTPAQRTPRHSELPALYRAQSAKLLDAEATISEKNRQINALTETISRLHQRDGGTSRDDDYLTAQFSDITNSITAWTVSNFQKSLQETITDLNKLPADLAQTVKRSVYDSTDILGSISSRRNLVNAVVVRAILHCMFKPFLFGAREAEDHLHAVSSQLQGTDYQIQRWRALTVNLLAQGPGYKNKYDRELSLIAVTLSNLLAHLAPVESDTEARNAELHKILGRAAALSVEIHKQTDLICLSPVEPGALFESNFMEDLGYKYELHELDGKAVVQVPIFPAVIRRSCAPGGMLSEPYYVMKARVTTTFANQD